METWAIVIGWLLALFFFVVCLVMRGNVAKLVDDLTATRHAHESKLRELDAQCKRNAVNAGVGHWRVDKYGEPSFYWNELPKVVIVTSADLTGYPIMSSGFKVTLDMLKVDRAKLEAADLVVYLGLGDEKYQVVKQRTKSLLEAARGLG